MSLSVQTYRMSFVMEIVNAPCNTKTKNKRMGFNMGKNKNTKKNELEARDLNHGAGYCTELDTLSPEPQKGWWIPGDREMIRSHSR